MSWSGASDRRRYKRVNLRLLLEFEDPESDAGGDKARMETINFSAGGFYCRFNRRTPPLTRLALRFVFPPFGSAHPAERAVECEAVVVRCEPEPGSRDSFRVAACFTSLSAEDRTYIQDYLTWYEIIYGEQEETAEAASGEEEDVA
jgi:hypothetical protein